MNHVPTIGNRFPRDDVEQRDALAALWGGGAEALRRVDVGEEEARSCLHLCPGCLRKLQVREKWEGDRETESREREREGEGERERERERGRNAAT